MNTIDVKDILVDWNANGIQSDRSTLVDILSRHTVDIVCALLKRKDTDTFKIAGYKVYRHDRKRTHQEV